MTCVENILIRLQHLCDGHRMRLVQHGLLKEPIGDELAVVMETRIRGDASLW